MDKNIPLAVLALKKGESFLGWALMAFSAFLSMKLMFHTLASGAEGSWVLVLGFFGILLGAIIDSAKCLSEVYMAINEGWRRWPFVLVFIATEFVSLVASYSELGRESYVSSLRSPEYVSLGETVSSNQATIDQYRKEVDGTRFHKRKDMYQEEIARLSAENRDLKTKQSRLVQEGAGETSFFNNSIRATAGFFGAKISYRGANLVFGAIIEIIAGVLVFFWARNNRDRIRNWFAMLAELVSSDDSRQFIERRVNAKKDLVNAMRVAYTSPVNAVDIDVEMGLLDLRIAARIADMQVRGAALPPTLQKKLDQIPLQQLADPEADRLLQEIETVETQKKLPIETETKNETIKGSFETTSEGFGFETKNETEISAVSKPETENTFGFSVGNGKETVEEYLKRIRGMALNAKKTKSEERFIIVNELKNNGLSNAEIGRSLGITGQAVGKLLRKGGAA